MNNRPKLHVLALNVAGASARQLALLNETMYSWFSVIMIQHPWWGKIGTNKSVDPDDTVIYGTSNSPDWIPFVPPGSFGSVGPGVVTYVRRNIPGLNARFSDIYPSHRDILPVDIYVKGSRTTLVNIYLHGDSISNSLNHLISHPFDHSRPIIWHGDFNLHHPAWKLTSAPHFSPSKNATILHDWISDNNINIINNCSTATRIGNRNQQDLVIDLTLFNQNASEKWNSPDWEATDKGALGSDHRAITWSISAHDQAEVFGFTEPCPGYSIDPDREEEWTEAFTRLVTEAGLPNALESAEDLDRVSKGILQAMTSATSETMPKRKKSKWKIRSLWWNDECNKCMRTLKASDRRGRATATAALRGAIRRARRAHADKICREILLDKVFGPTKWSQGKRRAPLPPIKSGNSVATEPQDKAKAFAEKFFPKAQADSISMEPLGVPYHPKRPHQVITHEEIENSLKESSNTSAPGAFGSNYRLLRWAFHAKPDLFTTFYNGCLDIGYHPTSLRNAVIAVIPKPRKSDMSAPKSYRPISLLETLSKLLEKVITKRITFESGKFNLIPHTQFGGRDMSSCSDAGICLVNDVHSAWTNAKFVSLLTLDVLGYFNNINHARLIYTCNRLGFSDNICNWLLSYLSNRTAQPKIDDVMCEPLDMPPVGVPQGSPLSPILSSIYSIPLLRCLSDVPNVSSCAYIDDFSILVSSNSHENNIDILQEACDVAILTLSALGLDFDVDKSDLIHFVKHGQSSRDPKLILHHPNGTEFEILAKHSIRWLGFFLDRKLDFKDHVRKMASKGLAALSGLKLLANQIRGMSIRHARMLYKACVVPILTYGSILWFHGRRQKSLAGSLERTQNVGLRWLLGAFKTTPVNALQHMSAIPPIHVYLHKLNANAAAKLRSLPKFSEVAKRLPAGWDTFDPSLPHIPARSNLAPISPITKLASMSHPEAEFRIPDLKHPSVATNPFPERLTLDPYSLEFRGKTKVEKAGIANRRIASFARDDTLIGFSDGSKIVRNRVRRVGIGYSITRNGREICSHQTGIGSFAEIYDAEMLGIALVTKQAVKLALNSHTRHIHIHSDNQAAILSILKIDPHPAQYASIIFREAALQFLNAHHENTLEVKWLPGHCGIHGNERADSLALAGTRLPPIFLFAGTITWFKAHASQRVALDWTKIWNNSKRSETVREHIRFPPSLHLNRIFTKNNPTRETTSRLVQCLTGHGFIGEYAARMPFLRDVDPSCKCGEPDQTLNHVLYFCPRYSESRKILIKASPKLDRTELFGTVTGLLAVRAFIHDCDALRPG